jgi:hypothetical protein
MSHTTSPLCVHCSVRQERVEINYNVWKKCLHFVLFLDVNLIKENGEWKYLLELATGINAKRE